MLIERLTDGWTITVPAKLNLFLEVVARRPDGFHDLETVMQAISLCDQLHIRPRQDSFLSLRMQPFNDEGFAKLSDQDRAWEIPTDHRNLIIRALEAVRNQLRRSEGLDVELRKGIPSQAGLGGGSADAAAAIVGGMLALTNRYNEKLASQIAEKLGSDVNFFLEGNGGQSKSDNWLAKCTGRGELVEPLKSKQRLHFLVLHPPMGCSTQKVFSRLASLHREELSQQNCLDMVDALEFGNEERLSKLFFNRLTKAASEETQWIWQLMNVLRTNPLVLGCEMTGSGSAVYGSIKNFDDAEKLADSLRQAFKVRAYAVSTWQTPTICSQLEQIAHR
jgi:4-diphosphocytidyl-2-C-methyl-D-erythritol kinase